MRKLSVLWILLLFGCELVVDVDVPFEGSRLTLNSFFSPDSAWSATVHLNRYILDEQPFQPVTNANVLVYSGDVLVSTLTHRGDGVYTSDTEMPIVGKEYRIEASAPGLPAVTATSSAPRRTEILSVDMKETNHGMNGIETSIKLRFKDDAAQKDYYRVQLETIYESYNIFTGSVETHSLWMYIENNDPQNESQDGTDDGSVIVSDVLFNGDEVELSLSAEGSVGSAAIVRVTLSSLSEDYYRYELSSQLQDNVSGDPFAQPANVFNNIENGFGIFAGFNTSTYEYGSPKPLITGISPLSGQPGDRVVITGENFPSSSDEYVNIRFNGYPYPITANTTWISPTEIEAIVPEGAVTGRLVLNVNNRVAVSDEPFQVN